MDKAELMELVDWLHPDRNGFRKMRMVSRSRRSKGDFHFSFMGIPNGGTLYVHAAAQLVADGWYKIVALDADTEILMQTELGDLLVAELETGS